MTIQDLLSFTWRFQIPNTPRSFFSIELSVFLNYQKERTLFTSPTQDIKLKLLIVTNFIGLTYLISYLFKCLWLMNFRTREDFTIPTFYLSCTPKLICRIASREKLRKMTWMTFFSCKASLFIYLQLIVKENIVKYRLRWNYFTKSAWLTGK